MAVYGHYTLTAGTTEFMKFIDNIRNGLESEPRESPPVMILGTKINKKSRGQNKLKVKYIKKICELKRQEKYE